MSKNLYGAPWSPNVLQMARNEKAEVVKKSNVVVDEGREIVDKDGTPRVGCSAYGLCVKASGDINVV